ncbi:MAG: DNA-3-methyladenine glycosylase [Anaerolineae bacterium]
MNGKSSNESIRERLCRSFYAREPQVVARDLIGKVLVRVLDDVELKGQIVEAEAYRGTNDAASHAYRGVTPRNAPMFGPPGHTYVYFIYGVHWMFNIAAHTSASPGAVLIRALAPLAGLERMRELRGGKPDRLLTNGPARLAQALAIDGSLDDLDLCTSDTIYVAEGEAPPKYEVASGPRVRVPGGEEAKSRPWRFWLRGHPYVSD